MMDIAALRWLGARRVSKVAIAAALCSLVPCAAHAQRNEIAAALFQKTTAGPLTVLAKAGDPAPGTGGFFTSFDDIAENHNNDVAFIARYKTVTGKKWGVFLKPSGGPVVAIVLDGDALPNGCGRFGSVNGDTPDGPWINDAQTVAFQIDAECGSGTMFVKKTSMPIEVFIAEGEDAPISLGGTIDGINVGRPGLNNADTMGFKAGLSDSSNGESALLTRMIGGSTDVCVKEGDPAPGTSGTFSGFAENPAINKDNRLFVQADVSGDPGVTQGIFTCLAGATQKIALEGEPEPGTSSTFCDSIEEGSLSDDGRVTFLNECFPTGVFVTGPGGAAVTNVALEGDPAPGTNGETFTCAGCYANEADVCSFGCFDEPFVNTSGDVAFGSAFTGGGFGIFLSSGGVVTAVGVSGQFVPGIGTLSKDFDGPALNNLGTVAFVNRLNVTSPAPVLSKVWMLFLTAALIGIGVFTVRRKAGLARR